MNRTLGFRSDRPSNNLDFIRFLLAASVCFTHSFNLLYGDNTDPLGVATGGLVGLGGLAVDMFFVISGFLIFRSWENSSGFKEFIVKRILRIYPAFLVVTILCGLVFAPLGTYDVAAYFSDFRPWLFFRGAIQLELPILPRTLPDVAFPNLINGSLWTIKYEFICYVILGVAGLLRVLGSRWILLFLFLISLSIFSLQGYFHSREMLFPLDYIQIPRVLGNARAWPRFFTYFLAGMVYYAFRNEIRQTRLLLCLAILLALILVVYLRVPNIAIPLLGPYLIYYVAFSDSLKFHEFGRFGDFSYGVYLYAFPVQQILAFYWRESLNGISMFFVSMAITTILAILSWNFVEKPCLALKRKFRLIST